MIKECPECHKPTEDRELVVMFHGDMCIHCGQKRMAKVFRPHPTETLNHASLASQMAGEKK